MNNPTVTVAPLRFDDLSGEQFERLVFAYHVRSEPKYSFEWIGQSGGDDGRDIVGTSLAPEDRSEKMLIACANWRKVTSTKAISDLDKVLKSPIGTPARFRFVTGCQTITATVRDEIAEQCKSRNVYEVEIWSSQEFEEHLRARAQSLLKRMFEGEIFPDRVPDLICFAQTTPPASDLEIIVSLERVFDRPAFTTRMHLESSLPAFKQAIEDTISAINTGIWKTRNGTIIARLPDKTLLKDQQIRNLLEMCVDQLVSLRSVFDAAVRSGDINHCSCGIPDCPTYSMNVATAQRLTDTRSRVLAYLAEAKRLAAPHAST